MKTVLLFLAATLCFAQADEKAGPAPKFYRFDFVVREMDGGKVLNTKNYSALGGIRGRYNQIMIRAGEKVPVLNAKGETTFVDVGTNLDCTILAETAGDVGLQISADISSAGPERPPLISQTKWISNTLVPLKKATVVFSSESATKKVVTQLEITVTPLQ